MHNHIRGLSPYPGAFAVFTEHGDKEVILKIYRTGRSVIDTSLKPGEIKAGKDRLYIGCGDTPIEILEIQQQGKKRMPASEFVKGYRNDKQLTWKPE